jgi:ArsR family transcriptional regulator
MGLVFIYVNAYMLGMRDLALFYAAMADETRLRLLGLLAGGEVCVCHLQAVLKTNQPKISRHLAYLRRAGLVAARRDGRWTHYRLKKLDHDLEKIRAHTLANLKRQPQVNQDRQRIKSVAC